LTLIKQLINIPTMKKVTTNKGIESSQKLFNSAILLFAEKGYNKTSIRDIALAAGINSANVYHYFKSKEGLLLAVLDYLSDLLLKNLIAITELKINPMERFKLLLENHLRSIADRKNEAMIFVFDRIIASQGMEVIRQNQRKVLEIYVCELGKLEGAGYIRSRNHKVLAFNILGVINWYTRWYRPTGALSREETIEEVTSFILHGMLGRGSERDHRSGSHG